MLDTLIIKLKDYLINDRPDLMVTLEQEGKVTTYLEDKIATITNLCENLLKEGKPAYIVEEVCMEELTKDLHPSKFNYLLLILEEEFETDYYRIKENGILYYEVINLMNVCEPVFERLGFTEETETDRSLRYAIISEIHLYLKSN
jgi:hypothetical protein